MDELYNELTASNASNNSNGCSVGRVVGGVLPPSPSSASSCHKNIRLDQHSLDETTQRLIISLHLIFILSHSSFSNTNVGDSAPTLQPRLKVLYAGYRLSVRNILL